MMSGKKSIWHGQVRDYELDSQGIVNNANYLHYFEHARHVALSKTLGINFIAYQQQGIDFVMSEVCIKYHASLYSEDLFSVETTFNIQGRLRIIAEQKIFIENKLIVDAQTTIVCINRDKGKPVMPTEVFDAMKS
ncbi:acyl-CoA thioesterase [Shewanella surugensis]|uniref:Acyl-CoA thioesterase n=1 Tax=Shewanella surugensis TaxID=212020 RepID=A0ABT0LHV0_9GAMM|nr:thioesterase family protein [Shewanella surugensis]MCL1127291.1 acyl-CoA thioesterase [Shewanella surugensis]